MKNEQNATTKDRIVVSTHTRGANSRLRDNVYNVMLADVRNYYYCCCCCIIVIRDEEDECARARTGCTTRPPSHDDRPTASCAELDRWARAAAAAVSTYLSRPNARAQYTIFYAHTGLSGLRGGRGVTRRRRYSAAPVVTATCKGPPPLTISGGIDIVSEIPSKVQRSGVLFIFFLQTPWVPVV